MTFKAFSSLLLLAICSYCGYYFLSNLYWEKEQQVEIDAEKPLLTAKGIETVNYDMQGVRVYSLASNNLEHYQSIDETHFNKPLLYTFKEGVHKEWQVSSNSAVLKDKHLLVMSGNVTVNNLLPQAQLKTITTNQITLDLTSRDFWTQSETIISGVNFQTRGDSSKGNFGTHIMELNEKVNTVYE